MATIVSSEVPQARCMVMPGCQRRQSGGQRGLAAEVPVAGMLDHRAHRDFAQLLAVQAELLDQRAEGADRHAEVADVRVGGVLAAERNTDAAEHGDGTAGRIRAPRCGNLGTELPGP
jgi:hypothetical protein